MSEKILALNLNKQTNLYVFDMNRRVLKQVDKNEFNQCHGPVILIKRLCKVKLLTGKPSDIQRYRFVFDKIYQSEGLLNLMYGSYQGCKTLITATNNMLKNSGSVHLQALLLDASSLILQHGTGTYNNWTPSFLIGFLTRVYSIFIRTKDLIKPTSESLDSLLIMGASIGLPDSVFAVLKRMNVLTNKKIGDHPGLCLDLIQSVSEYLLHLCQKATWLPTAVVEFMTKMFTFGTMQKLNYRMKVAIEEWKQDKRVMLTPEFRNSIRKIKQELDSNPDTPERLKIMLNFKSDYNTLERMVKGAAALEKCSRQEPVCVVLEGLAGTKKSIVMLQILKLLRRSYYTHIVKSVDDGKDHYDGYNNEDVFVIDDMGQQGVSQWRTIINMVSSVKMPLECASVDLKDTKYFDSKIILITTNRFKDLEGTFTKTDCVSDSSALFRRAHVFNFSEIGNVTFKRFDIIDHKEGAWVDYFIHPTNIPNKKRGGTFEIAVWMTALIEQMEEYYAQINSKVELTDSQVEIGRDMIEELKQGGYASCTEESLYTAISTFGLGINSVVGVLEDLLSTIEKHVLKYATNYGVMAVGIAAYGVYYMLSKCVTNDYQETDNSSVINDWNKAINHKSKIPTLIGGQVLLAESESDTLIQTVKNNVKIAKIFKYDGEYEITHCLVSGTNIVLPAHTIFESRKTLILYNSQEDFVQENRALDNCKFEVKMDDRVNDIAVIQLPLLNNTPYRNISHLFKHVDKAANHLYFVWSGDPVELKGTVKPLRENPMYITKYGNVYPQEVLTYEMTSKGFCGSIIVDKQLGIQGFHVAGDQSTVGIAKIFSQSVKSKIKILLEDGFDKTKDLVKVPNERFSGMVALSDKISDGPKNTHLQPSEFHEAFVASKQPADLRALGDKTVKLRARRMHKNVMTMDSKELEFMGKFLDWILPNFQAISEFEVVKGNEDLAALNKDSVSGFDFPKDKRDYFDFDTGEVKPEFKEQLEIYRTQCISRYPDKITQHHTLKDELRILEKVKKPRTFGVDSLTTQFEMKRLMGELFVRIKRRKWENGIAIGINPYEDWDKLYQSLKNCEKTWDGDIGEWDASVSPEIQDLVNEKVQKKFVGELNDRIILKRILDLSVRSWVVAGNKEMFKTHGILSGMWITNLFNSLINRCYTAGWYYRNYVKTYKQAPTVFKFLNNVVEFVQGDDKIVGVRFNDPAFSALTMKEYYESMGMTFTDGEKGLIDYESKNLFDCVFLKRKFNYVDSLNKMMGYIDPQTITNSIMWYKNDNDEQEIMQDKLYVFQIESFLMPHDMKKFLMSRIENVIKNKKLKYSFRSNDYLKQLFLSEPQVLHEFTKITLGKFY